jgi:hypothetical protein
MLDERSELTRRFAQQAHGYQREAVINAGGNMVLNAVRQNHRRLADAEHELEYLVERMKAALRENHYDSNGERRITNILVPPLEELVAATLAEG